MTMSSILTCLLALELQVWDEQGDDVVIVMHNTLHSSLTLGLALIFVIFVLEIGLGSRLG